MNKKILGAGVLVLIVIALILFPQSTQNKKSTEYIIDESDFVKGNVLIENIEPSELSESEVAGLILMREEEKLAKDVYLTLYDKWGLKIFNNIASSEQTHTDAVKVLIDRYNLSDPIVGNSIGIFESELLQGYYNDLTEKGSISLLDALIVGATVEDLDIKDLNELLSETDNEDITVTYNNLNKGSRNHLRAFIRQLESNGGIYEPQFISQDEFTSIILASQENGRA